MGKVLGERRCRAGRVCGACAAGAAGAAGAAAGARALAGGRSSGRRRKAGMRSSLMAGRLTGLKLTGLAAARAGRPWWLSELGAEAPAARGRSPERDGRSPADLRTRGSSNIEGKEGEAMMPIAR